MLDRLKFLKIAAGALLLPAVQFDWFRKKLTRIEHAFTLIQNDGPRTVTIAHRIPGRSYMVYVAPSPKGVNTWAWPDVEWADGVAPSLGLGTTVHLFDTGDRVLGSYSW